MHHRFPVAAALTTAFYAAPQVPADARRLWDAACLSAGLDQALELPLRPGRGHGSTLLLCREWEVPELEARLAEAIEASFEPSWDLARGEFTWGMGLNEEHPRGQFNAYLAAAEAASPGAWERLSEAPLEPCPQVVGVDFPAVGLTRAEWVEGRLHLGLAPLVEAPADRTSFSIVGLPPERDWRVSGVGGASVERGDGRLAVTVPVAAADLVVFG